MSDDRTLSPNQAAALLRCTGEAVKQWIYSGRLKAKKLRNGYWRISVEDFEDFLHRRNQVPQPLVGLLGFSAEDLTILKEGCSGRCRPLEIIAASELQRHVRSRQLAALVTNIDSDLGWRGLKEAQSGRVLPVLIYKSNPLTDAELSRALDLGARACLTAPLRSSDVAVELLRLISIQV